MNSEDRKDIESKFGKEWLNWILGKMTWEHICGLIAGFFLGCAFCFTLFVFLLYRVEDEWARYCVENDISYDFDRLGIEYIFIPIAFLLFILVVEVWNIARLKGR